MAIATLTPPLVAVPVADAAGWRISLGMWAVVRRSSRSIPWIALLVRAAQRADPTRTSRRRTPGVFGRMWRIAARVGAHGRVHGVGSCIAYTSFAWLPHDPGRHGGRDARRGRRAAVAVRGDGAALLAARADPRGALQRDPRAVRRRRRRRARRASRVCSSPRRPSPWLWVALLGLAPLLFPLTLVLLGLRVRTHEGAVALSGFVQSIGYAIVALFPFGIGLLHGATDSWTWPLIILAVRRRQPRSPRASSRLAVARSRTSGSAATAPGSVVACRSACASRRTKRRPPPNGRGAEASQRYAFSSSYSSAYCLPTCRRMRLSSVVAEFLLQR